MFLGHRRRVVPLSVGCRPYPILSWMFVCTGAWSTDRHQVISDLRGSTHKYAGPGIFGETDSCVTQSSGRSCDPEGDATRPDLPRAVFVAFQATAVL